MATKLTRRTAASRRKLNPKSLKVKLEQLQRERQDLSVIRNEYFTLLNHVEIPKEVKVEKNGEEFVVKVSCYNKGGDKLVSILEAFDELGLDVVRASVSCGHLFSMEAIAVAQGQETCGIRDITHAVLNAIDEKRGGKVETIVT